MRVKLQLVMCHDEGHEETITDVITLNKHHQRLEHLGLTLAESKHLLSTLQRHLLRQQVATFLDARSTCPDCGTPLTLKAHGSRSLRPLFGTCMFSSPRLEPCDCQGPKTSSCRPLAALLTESVAPELLSMEAQWSSLVSYGMSLDALQDFLPLDRPLDVKTVRYDTLKVAKRMETELGEERSGCIAGDPLNGERLPAPEGGFTVGMDGGYVRHWVDKQHHFEGIGGKSILRFQEDEEDRTPSRKRFGFVQTYGDAKPTRRLQEVLHAQGLQMNQERTSLADGDAKLRALQREMSPKATHILDWFHLTRKLTVLGQCGKGLVQCEAVLGKQIQDQIARLQWSLGHGQVDKALGKMDERETSIAPCNQTYARFP
ncbi:MAG: ISKra4 family transposase [Candidatus Tectimicrobiota bacterium]